MKIFIIIPVFAVVISLFVFIIDYFQKYRDKSIIEKQKLKRKGETDQSIRGLLGFSFFDKSAKILVYYVYPGQRSKTGCFINVILERISAPGLFLCPSNFTNVSEEQYSSGAPISLGNISFDRKFKVFSRDDRFARKCINLDLQRILLARINIPISLRIKQNNLMLHIRSFPANEKVLDDLINISFLFRDKLVEMSRGERQL
ncbi:MAG: hypothetical protein ABH872_00790 [Candidatus Omnitrophota bacterium]